METNFWFDLIHWAVGILALHHDMDVPPNLLRVFLVQHGALYCAPVLDRQSINQSIKLYFTRVTLNS